MTKRKPKRKPKRAAWSGWNDYRYGSRPVTLPAVGGAAPIFGKKQRKALVDRIMDGMRDWRLTPFENEAPVWQALRSGLCLAGHSWTKADLEALSLVDECLRLMGAKRPDWEQGQPDYALGGDYCAWCQRPLSDDDELTGRARRHCSAECARAALQHRAFRERSHRDAQWAAAYRVVVQAAMGKRRCDTCGKDFYPSIGRLEQRFCSSRCYGATLVTLPMLICAGCGTSFRQTNSHNPSRYCTIDCYNATRAEEKKKSMMRRCEQCGTAFTSRHAARWCSPTCRGAAAQAAPPRTFDRECAWCGAAFTGKDHRAQCCGPRCSAAYSKAKKGILPAKITAPAFDFVFRRAA